MRPSSLVLAAAAIVLGTGAAAAREVYKCTNPQGEPAYQDRPCRTADVETRLHLDDSAPAPPASAPPAAVAAVEEKAPAAAPPAWPRKPLPAIWLCTNAEDGSHYVSRNGPPPPRAVPLGVLGFSSKSLADAYAPGSNVMSAPELSHPPIDRSPGAAVALGYAQLQDACAEANADQTCAYLRRQLDVTRDKLGHARFKDEQGELQSRLDALADDLGGC